MPKPQLGLVQADRMSCFGMSESADGSVTPFLRGSCLSSTRFPSNGKGFLVALQHPVNDDW